MLSSCALIAAIVCSVSLCHCRFCVFVSLSFQCLCVIVFSVFFCQGLLDLGASANYFDLQGLTPVYHCVCNNSSSKCLEMLLYDHAILGATDESNWTELHQVRHCPSDLFTVVSALHRQLSFTLLLLNIHYFIGSRTH